MTTSIAELNRQGITFSAAEAVAITQQLISGLRSRGEQDAARPPYGPPSPETVALNHDGSVVCLGCENAGVSEVGIFLDALLPEGSTKVPGGLRYSMARALLDVDVPPFDSLDDLSRDLARHERGDRARVVRDVIARSRVQPATGLALVDRRRGRDAASATELRRALREAEARLYEQQRIVAPIDVHPVPAASRAPSAAAACLAAGLALIAAGEFMHRRQPPIVLEPTAPLAAQLPAPAEPRAEPEPGIIAVRDVPRVTHAARPEVRRVALRRVSTRPAASLVRAQPSSRQPSRSVLDRLKLGWLRGAFSTHSDM